jgi:hypothetical protein
VSSNWETIFAPHLSNDVAESELIYCYGQWLKADKVSEDRFFIGLLFWKPDVQAGNQHQLQEANIHNLKNHIAELVKGATNMVSAYTSQLNQVSSETSDLLPVSVHFQTNHPVFQTPVKPKYNINKFTFSGGKDRLHLESMRQARQTPPQHITGGPTGG